MAIHAIGSLRQALKEDFISNFNKVLDEQGDRESYYVFCHTSNIGNKFETKMMLLNEKLPDDFIKKVKVLGTQMYHVDNKAGKLDMLWCLPLDIPVTSTINQTDEICEWIAQDVKDSNIQIVF